jgi:small conductance mechanosensitive channel
VDDFIEAQGYSGTVEDIRITRTRIRTGDNKVVYLPNGALSGGSIVNYSEKDIRRVDNSFSIAYSNDFEKAKAIITRICNEHDLILKDPAITVRVSAHSASSIDIVTRVWVKSSNYWTVHFDLLESVKTAFDKEGIEIPFNQLDVHVTEQK